MAEGDRQGLILPPFGLPEDGAAWAAAALSVAAFALLPFALAAAKRRRALVLAAAVAAGALSAAYVAVYLRGGPRIVDATTYLLQARAMSHGLLAWEPLDPSASVAGRFLVRDAMADGSHLAGIFPPGWPALLAVGVLVGAPMAVGPLLAVGLTLATAWLARELTREVAASTAPTDAQRRALDLVPALAAVLSAACACLRYHTADTMSHGLAATLAAMALAAALRARVDPGWWLRVVTGLAVGWLVATRPISGAAIALVVAAVAPRRARDVVPFALALLPGVALLLVHQRAATGAWLTSSQSLYYALSDGPPGCFRWGFGEGIGCLHEHGEFVAANLGGGYGPLPAIATTLRRLKAHLVDPLNLEPLLALVVVGGFAARRSRIALRVALAPVVLLAAYAPFYFDGNFPGGGARFLADALPVEHALAALGAMAVVARLGPLAARRPERIAAAVVSLGLAGFAVRAGFDHALLRDREGGAPMFDPAVVRDAGVNRGVVFVDTDHGFAIGHDPGQDPREGVHVLRHLGDDLDAWAWTVRGRPPAFRYVISTLADGVRGEARLVPFEPPEVERIEGESLWPAAAAVGVSAWPRWAQGTCASGGRWLGVSLAADEGAIDLDLPHALGAPHVALGVRLHREPGVTVRAALVVDGAVVAEEALPGTAPSAGECEELSPLRAPSAAARQVRLRLVVAVPGAAAPGRGPGDPVVALDAIAIEVRH